MIFDLKTISSEHLTSGTSELIWFDFLSKMSLMDKNKDINKKKLNNCYDYGFAGGSNSSGVTLWLNLCYTQHYTEPRSRSSLSWNVLNRLLNSDSNPQGRKHQTIPARKSSTAMFSPFFSTYLLFLLRKTKFHQNTRHLNSWIIIQRVYVNVQTRNFAMRNQIK